MPLSTFAPTSERELETVIGDAIAAKAPLEVIGTGTKEAIGRPVQAAATLDLSGFAGIAAYEPEELVLTAGAGTLLSDIEAEVSAKGQAFAFEPPDLSRLLGSAHAGTLGGLLSSNLSGPRRIKMGAVRDHVLGFAGVSGRGEAFKAGGRVVKNVTGYDLAKLMANSWGTLAALTSITFKVLPKPETEETLIIEGLNDEDAVRAMSLAMQSSCEVSGASHLPAGLGVSFGFPAATTLLRLEGVPPSIAYRRDVLAGLLKSFGSRNTIGSHQSQNLWRAVRDVAPFAEEHQQLIWRVSVPPAAGPETLAAISRALPARGFYDWAGGLIWLAVPASDDGNAHAIRSAIAEGHATLIRAPRHIRAGVAVFAPQPVALDDLSRRVKAAFDPAGILNPGRMYQGW